MIFGSIFYLTLSCTTISTMYASRKINYANSNKINIAIPRILDHVTVDMITQSFAEKKIGTITAIYRYNRINENGHPYWFAFAVLKPIQSLNSKSFVKLLTSGKKTFVMYTLAQAWTSDEWSTHRQDNQPFVEVSMHIRDLIVVNPTAAAALPIAAKKGFTGKQQKRRNAIAMDGDWTFVGSKNSADNSVSADVRVEVERNELLALTEVITMDQENSHPIIATPSVEWNVRTPIIGGQFSDADALDFDQLLRDIDQYRTDSLILSLIHPDKILSCW
jgi:hypothetical protein